MSEQSHLTEASRALRLGVSWAVIELKLFFRVPAQVFFTFTLPVLLLFIFAAIFSGDIEAGPGRSLSFVQYFLPGIIASGVMSATFANLAMSIAVQQHEGLLKRLAGTPFPRSAFFIGKGIEAIVVTVIQTGVMLAIAVVVYDADLPDGPARWLAFLVVLILGAATGATLGIAYTRLVPNANAAPAVVQPPFLVLQFISGVFVRYNQVPGWLRTVASVFPLRWMSEGLRYAFLPDEFGKFEYGDSWGWQWPLAVLSAWLVVGFLLALVFFRWDREGS